LVVRVLKSDNTWCDIEILGKNRLDDPLVNGVVVSARYVSGPCLSQRVLAAGDYLYQSVATTASDGTTIFDAEGRRVYTSSSLCAMLGYTAAELQALGPGELMFPGDMSHWRSATRDALQSTEGVSRLECRVVKKDGSLLWIEVTVVNLLNQSGVNGVVAHIRDIHERRSLQQELIRRASVDELTGLANRAAFVERLVLMEQQGVRRTLLFCDLDGFKSVNDVLGHAAGDRLLHGIGVGLRVALGDATFVARMGGDEFCMVMPATTDVDSTHCAHTVIDTVDQVAYQQFGDMLDIGPLSLRIGVSVGVASDATDLSNTTSLLSRADHAMYSSKRRGPNHVTLAE
jgi:diguanylate cyclase (GGDEF)-like protein/PAS domain S-box-containing protein